MRVNFEGTVCNVTVETYAEGHRTAIELVDAATGDHFATATVNVPEVPLSEGEVLVKDYNENAGILAALQRAGILEPTGRVVPVGFAAVAVCRLLVDPKPAETD